MMLNIKTMHKKFIYTIFLLIAPVVFLHAQSKKYNFNHGWKLFIGEDETASGIDYDDSGWKSITLPYAWNQEEAYLNDIKDLSTGVAWYRKSFQIPENAVNSKVFIEFEGVRQMGEVYINGHYIGRHENGVMAFGFDITPFIHPFPKNNVIAVKTDNDWKYKEKLSGFAYQWNNINFNANYGGIPKNVFLHIKPKLYQTLPLYSTLGTTGTYVFATDIDIPQKKAYVHAETQVRNETTETVDVELQMVVKDLDGTVKAEYAGDHLTISPNGMIELTAADTIKDLKLWSVGYGYLYDVYTKLVVDGEVIDEVKTRTGFRKTAYKNGMIYLNDRVIMMKGYAQRTSNEWPSVGMSVPAWMSDYSNRLVIEGNGNMYRWMHVTPWKQDVESCDRVGLIQAMPAGDAEKDVFDHRWQQRTQLMRDAIIYNRNSPSILFYECGNESISEEHMTEMLSIKQKYDPFGGRAIGSREMLDSEVAEYGGEMLYINKSADIPFWAMEYSRDEGLRKYWDEYTPPYHKDGEGPLYRGKDASEYNRNQDSHAIEDVVRWYDYWEMRPGTGKRVSSGGANIIFSDTNTHHRGKENYRRSGEVDPMRIPKDNYWAHKVIWNGWVDTDSVDIHILGHWNYAGDVQKPITVVSTADEVELFVNNKSYGKGDQSYRFLFTFDKIKFEAGEIKAVGYNKSGKQVCETFIKTAGKPAAIKLTKMERPGGMLADGNDIAIIQVEVVDENGNRCPTALNEINFGLKGAGEYLGGIAQGPGNYIGSETLPVECGVNRVLVRSTKKAGEIKITAKSKGLDKASIELETHETDLSDLSEILPYNGIPVNLGNGPTLSTPSYSVKRRALEVKNIIAVSNPEIAYNTIDDNEFTEWKNDGKLSSAIIEFELEEKSLVEQAVLKLNGWRRRSYPISIFVDNQKVFEGETPRSLGYVTLNLEPTVGSKIRIELTGATTDEDRFNIVEITGKVDQAGLDSEKKEQRVYLRILEAEFYHSVKE